MRRTYTEDLGVITHRAYKLRAVLSTEFQNKNADELLSDVVGRIDV